MNIKKYLFTYSIFPITHQSLAFELLTSSWLYFSYMTYDINNNNNKVKYKSIFVAAKKTKKTVI